MKIALRRTLGAVRRMNAVPDRRIRLLQRFERHRHIVEREVLAVEIQTFHGKAFEDELKAFAVDFLRRIGVFAIDRRLDQRRAAAQTNFKPSAADLVEHANLLDQAQRMIERQHKHHRPEAEPPRALRQCGKKDVGRRRHAQRCRVMLCQVIAVETGAIVGFGDLEAVLVVIGKRRPGAIEMVEDAEFDFVTHPVA